MMRTDVIVSAAHGDACKNRVGINDGKKRLLRRSSGIRWLSFLLVMPFCLFLAPLVFADIIGAEITASPSTIQEGGSSLFTVTLTSNFGDFEDAIVVVEASGSATLGVDYEIEGVASSPFQLDFEGIVFVATQTITVRALSDNVALEGAEEITLTITECTWFYEAEGTCPTGSSATVSIIDTSEFDLSIESGNGQVASGGQPLQPFVVELTSQGAAAAGIPIVWTLETGAGTLSTERALTDSRGRASSNLTPSSNGEFVVRARVEGTSESVVFTSFFNPLSNLPGLTVNERRMARTVETLCPRLGDISEQRALTAGEQDLLNQCRALIESAVSSPGAAAQGVAALTPGQASAPRKLTIQVTGAQLDNITTRLMALRRGARGVSMGNLTVNVDGQNVSGNTISGVFRQAGETGGGASADDAYEFERLGIFVNGNIDWGDKDRTDNEEGFDFETLGISAGVDYRFLDGLVLGIALGYGDTAADFDTDGGDLGTNAWSSTLYGTYYATDHFYLEGSATYGWSDFDQTRNISYGLLGTARKAQADYDGSQHAFMFGAGYDFIRGEGILDVYGRLRYMHADLDGYREQGASGLDLEIDSQEATSFKSILGINYTRSFSTAKAVLVPQGWVEWAHEFEDGDDQVSGVFANDPSRIPFALLTDKFDADYFRLGLGLGAQFGQGRTAFVSYEAAIGLNSYTEHTVNLGLRLDF